MNAADTQTSAAPAATRGITPVSMSRYDVDFQGFSDDLGASFKRYGFAVIADHGLAFLAAWMADAALAIGRLDHAMAAVAANDQAFFRSGTFAAHAVCACTCSSASIRAAQSRSVGEMPFTSCVFRRTTQRL